MTAEKLPEGPKLRGAGVMFPAWIACTLALTTLGIAALRMILLLLDDNVKDALDERTLAAPLVAGLLVQLPRMKSFKGFGVETELVEEVTKQVVNQMENKVEEKIEASEKRTEKLVVNRALNDRDGASPGAALPSSKAPGKGAAHLAPQADSGSGVGPPIAGNLLTKLRELPRPSDGRSQSRYDWVKGRFGGKPEAAGRRLRVDAKQHQGSEWMDVTLRVESTNGQPVAGRVVFFVHDSFPNYYYARPTPSEKDLSVFLTSYGAFTAAAVCIDEPGTPMMEVDLVDALPDAPKWFLDR